MHEHIGKRAKMQKSKESQTGGTKQARQAYKHCTEERKVHNQAHQHPGDASHKWLHLIWARGGWMSPHKNKTTGGGGGRAQSMAKPRSREANMEIKYRNKQANIEM